MSGLKLVLILYCAFLSVALVDLISVVIAAKVCFVGVTEAGLFRSIKLIILNLQGTRIKLGLIPFPSSYIQFQVKEPGLPAETKVFTSLPVSLKILITLSGVILNIAIASCILGFQPAINSSLRGMIQLLTILVNRDLGFYYLQQGLMLEQISTMQAWALLTTKVVSLNLLPIPGLYGGFILITGWKLCTGKSIPPDKLGELTLLSLVIILAMFLYTWGEVILRLITRSA